MSPCCRQAKNRQLPQSIPYDGELDCAYPDNAITLTLEDEIDISRGDMLVHTGHEPTVTNQFSAHVVWMDEAPLRTHKDLWVKFATHIATGKVTDIQHKIDVNTLDTHAPNSETLALNEIALADFTLTEKTPLDSYQSLPKTGAFVLIDRYSNLTVGAGMVKSVNKNGDQSTRTYTEAEKALNAYIREHYPEWGCREI
jgi:GTPases - Sulfate adenylate transferase subunit 1